MGEYATYDGERIKIGTCEDMFYLRADQVAKIRALPGNVDPRSADDLKVIRFRFPWPDEDAIEPGAFEEYHRAVPVDIDLPAEVEHYSVQFTAPVGYLLSVPCPEGPAASHGLTIHRNGFPGRVQLVQQAYRGGLLVAICRCGGCGAPFRLPRFKDAEPLIVALRARADKDGNSQFWHTIADRVAAGYMQSSVV